MIDVIFTIILFMAFGFVALITWTLCKMASESDKILEEEWQEFRKKEREQNGKCKTDKQQEV